MGNKTRWRDGDEAVISFKHCTSVDGQWTGEYDRFTYDAQKLPNLAGKPLYNETLVQYWLTLNSNDTRLAVWTDNREGATWTGNQQIGLARNSLVKKQITKVVRENANMIGNYSGGKSDIGALSQTQIQRMSNCEIFNKVFGKGVPDIFRWNAGSDDLKPEFIEVKSRDDLLESQKEWFDVFNDVFPGYRATIHRP